MPSDHPRVFHRRPKATSDSRNCPFQPRTSTAPRGCHTYTASRDGRYSFPLPGSSVVVGPVPNRTYRRPPRVRLDDAFPEDGRLVFVPVVPGRLPVFADGLVFGPFFPGEQGVLQSTLSFSRPGIGWSHSRGPSFVLFCFTLLRKRGPRKCKSRFLDTAGVIPTPAVPPFYGTLTPRTYAEVLWFWVTPSRGDPSSVRPRDGIVLVRMMRGVSETGGGGAGGPGRGDPRTVCTSDGTVRGPLREHKPALIQEYNTRLVKGVPHSLKFFWYLSHK